MKKGLLFLMVVLLSFSFVYLKGQDVKLDSLKNVLKQAKHDTTRIKTYLKIGHHFKYKVPDSARYYYQKALELADLAFADSSPTLPDRQTQHKAQTSNNYAKLKATSLRNIGYVHYKQSSYDDAKEYYLKALEISEELQDKGEISACYTLIGIVHNIQGDYDKSIEYTLKSIEMDEELSDKKGMSKSYNSIGLIHQFQESYDKAMEYFLKALEIAEELQDKDGMSRCYNNIGNNFMLQGSHDKAIEYFLKALEIAEELQDNRSMLFCYYNISGIYETQGNLDQAMEYQLKSLEIRKKLKRKSGLSLSYNSIGRIHSKQGSYDKAIAYYLKSLKIREELQDKYGMSSVYEDIALHYIMLADSSPQITAGEREKHLKAALEYGYKAYDIALDIGAVRLQKFASAQLQKACTKLGLFEEANKYAEIYIAAQDSMFSEEKANALAEITTKYETEKKEALILALENENLEKDLNLRQRTNQRNIYLLSGAGITLILLISFTLQKQKSIKDKIIATQKVQQLEEERKLLSAKFIVEGQEEERKRIAKELHDGLGVLLSTAKMQFMSIKDRSPENKPLIEKATKLLEQATGDVRMISHNMMPGLLTKYGLFEAVEDLFEQLDETEELNVGVNIFGKAKRLPENTEIMLYRVIQEMVNNTLKHAEANKILVEMKIHPEILEIQYSDDGNGFDVEEKINSKSIGLQSIQSRVNFLNGELNVESEAEKGTIYGIKIPT